jgi:hypothetical protein
MLLRAGDAQGGGTAGIAKATLNELVAKNVVTELDRVTLLSIFDLLDAASKTSPAEDILTELDRLIKSVLTTRIHR